VRELALVFPYLRVDRRGGTVIDPVSNGNLRGVEELAGQRDHAVHEVGLDQASADLTLAGLVRRHGAVGEHEADHACGREVVDDVLDPGEVGVAG